jgi:hypothetical protein
LRSSSTDTRHDTHTTHTATRHDTTHACVTRV